MTCQRDKIPTSYPHTYYLLPFVYMTSWRNNFVLIYWWMLSEMDEGVITLTHTIVNVISV